MKKPKIELLMFGDGEINIPVYSPTFFGSDAYIKFSIPLEKVNLSTLLRGAFVLLMFSSLATFCLQVFGWNTLKS